MLGPHAHERRARSADALRLVIATDVLSEGVNLQHADTIVHLDLPWTPAGLEQRVGRAARIGSRHSAVFVFGIAPPPPAMAILSMTQRLDAKRAAARQAFETSDHTEALREQLARWHGGDPLPRDSGVAAVRASRDGFIAVVRSGSGTHLVGGTRWRGGYSPSDEPATLRALATAASDDAIAVPPRTESLARAAIARFLGRTEALSVTGLERKESDGCRTVLARLDHLMSGIPANDRPKFADRSTAIRSALRHIAGAGAERALEVIACDKQSDDSAWLTSLEAIIARFRQRKEEAVAAEPPAVTALLLLVTDARATISAAAAKESSRARRSPSP